MDRALWLLLELRIWAWVRRLGRMLRTVRGILLLASGGLIFGLWAFSLFWQTAAVTPEHLADVRRYGPLALVGIFLANLLLSTSERAIAFTSAEVNFLFPAPFTRRQLLAYKLTASCGGAVLTALFMAVILRAHVALFVAAFVGLTLTLVFMQLLTMLLALLASALGARAYNRRRKVVLLAVAAVAVVAVYQAGLDVLRRDWQEVLAGVEHSAVVQFLLAPLCWFMEAATAEWIWPDLAKWSALALGVNACLAVLVFVVDAQYLEASAAASEKTYARLQRARRGGVAMVGLPRSGRARFSLPALPGFGGIGPLAWRQLTTAVRGIWSLLMLLIFCSFFLAPMLAQAGKPASTGVPPSAVAGFIAAMTFFCSPLLPFDFRGDLDRMDVLKALPLSPWRMVVGQLLAPVVLTVGFQWIVLGLMQIWLGRMDVVLLATAMFLVPVNVLVFEIENLFFLWFPTRLSMAPGDFQALGRHMLLWLAKFFTLLVTVGAAALAGFVTYLVTGESWSAALIVAWLVMGGAVVGLIPLVALAFRQFDVAGDVPP